MSLYSNVKFKPYQYEEYPKMIYVTEANYPHGGQIVHNEEEEFALLGYLQKDKYPKAETLANELEVQQEGERNFLIGILSTMGAKFNQDDTVEELRETLGGFAQKPANPMKELGSRFNLFSKKPNDPIDPIAPIQPIESLDGDPATDILTGGNPA